MPQTRREERLTRVRTEAIFDVEHGLKWLKNGGPADYDLQEAARYLSRSAAAIEDALTRKSVR